MKLCWTIIIRGIPVNSFSRKKNGHISTRKTQTDGFLNLLAFVIFAIFGCTTLLEGCTLLFGGASPLRWAVTGVAAAIFEMCIRDRC